MNNGLTKTYVAGAAIAAHRIVMFSALVPGALDVAVDGSAAILGVSTDVAAVATERVDVVHAGIVKVQSGAAFSAGDPITAGAGGKAVEAAPVATASAYILGYALEDAAGADELVDVLVTLGRISNALNA